MGHSYFISCFKFEFFLKKPVEQFLPGSFQESISGRNYHHWYFSPVVVPLEEVQRLAVNEELTEIRDQSRSRWSSVRS